jgi:FAD/FMN-containing dehydrogenase
VHRPPHAVVLPASSEDVAATIRWAVTSGRKVAAQGRNHSVFGRGQIRDGIVCDMTACGPFTRSPPTGWPSTRAVYNRVRSAGGVLYPVSALPMSPHEWEEHFGKEFAALAEAKRTYDPDDVLAPGYDLFPSPRNRSTM